MRAGYIAQDEMPVYQSRGVLVRSEERLRCGLVDKQPHLPQAERLLLSFLPCHPLLHRQSKACPNVLVQKMVRPVGRMHFSSVWLFASRSSNLLNHTHSQTSLPDGPATKPKTKAAAKNAKRKEKRAAETAEKVTTGMQSLGLGCGASSGAALATAAAEAAPAAHTTPAAAAGAAVAGAADARAEPPAPVKQLRSLLKKIRQAEQLQAKRAEGKALTDEENAKLGRLEGWRAEATALEVQVGSDAT